MDALLNFQNQWYMIVLLMLYYVDGPYFLIKYLPKMFGYILAYKIRRFISVEANHI